MENQTMGNEPRVCECCCYPAGELVDSCPFENDPKSGAFVPGRRVFKICKLCANTAAGHWQKYSNVGSYEAMEIVKTICFVGNAILDAVKGQETPR